MSILLRRLQSNPHFQKKEPEPPPAALDTSQLNAALGELIQQAARAGAEEAVRKQPAPAPKAPARSAVPEHLREFTDKPLSSEWPDPPPQAKPVRDLTVSLQRNEVGRVKSVSIGKTNFIALRDGEGRLIGMRQED